MSTHCFGKFRSVLCLSPKIITFIKLTQSGTFLNFLKIFFLISFQSSYTLELYYMRFLHLCPSKTKLHPSLSLVCFIVSCFGVLNCFTNIHILAFLVCMIGNPFFSETILDIHYLVQPIPLCVFIGKFISLCLMWCYKKFKNFFPKKKDKKLFSPFSFLVDFHRFHLQT